MGPRTVPPASSPSQIHWLQLRDWSGDDTEEWTGLRNQGGKGMEPDQCRANLLFVDCFPDFFLDFF